MTLTEARAAAKESLETAFTDYGRKVYVDVHDGVMTADEIKRRFSALPSVLVSVLGRAEDGIILAVYVIGRPGDAEIIGVVDMVESVLRSLSGSGSAPLDVKSECLYNSASGKAGATFWAVSALWPLLADGSAAGEAAGIVSAANTFLSGIITSAFTESCAWTIGATENERQRLMNAGPLPFVLITHKSGKVEHKTGSYRYEEDGLLYSRKVKGVKVWPVTVSFWGRSEDEADNALLNFAAVMPREWTYLNKQNAIKTVTTGSEYNKKYGANVASIELQIDGVLTADAERIPTFTSAAREVCTDEE